MPKSRAAKNDKKYILDSFKTKKSEGKEGYKYGGDFKNKCKFGSELI